MSTDAYEQLVADSLALPIKQRGKLAAAILRSLDDELPEGQERSPEEWEAEIERRSDELHSGQVQALDARESLDRVRQQVARRS